MQVQEVLKVVVNNVNVEVLKVPDFDEVVLKHQMSLTAEQSSRRTPSVKCRAQCDNDVH